MKLVWSVTLAWMREATVSLLSQRVSSAVTLLIVMGATVTVISTAGRNAGVESAVLSQIDARGTRSLTVYAQGDQPAFGSALVSQLAGYDVMEEVIGLGSVVDVTAAEEPLGPRVGLRTAYGTIGGRPLAGAAPVGGLPSALANEEAIRALGLPGPAGSVRAVDDGPEWLVAGAVALPNNMAGMGPTILVAGDPADDEPLATLIVLARRPEDLPLVTKLVAEALHDVPREKVKIESSEELADLRAVIGGELSTRSRSIILSVLAGSAAASLAVAWALALMRRRDFGRRRALGATRSMIVGLLVGQTLVLALLGSLAGAAIGLGLLAGRGEPVPSRSFVSALVTLFALTTSATVAVPALWAANRDPLRELRVP